MFDIIAVGSATLDIYLKSESFPLNKSFVGGKIEVSEMLASSGGGGTNTAAGFSRLGLLTACIARVGDDVFGNYVMQDLEKETFSKKYLIRRKNDNNDYTTVLVNPDGSRTILVYRGKTRIEEADFPWEALDETKWLYIASMEGNVDLLVKVICKAFEKGVKVALNPGSREIKDKEKILPILSKLEVLILNKEEADLLNLSVDVQEKPRIIIETNGKQGVRLYSQDLPAGRQGENLFADALMVETVDETGAGDSFSSGFVGGLVMGFPLRKSLKLGVVNSAANVTKMGGKDGLLGKYDMNGWMRKKLRIEHKI